MYDFLIVGAGLYGSVLAHELSKINKKVLVIDKRNHIGGNVFTEKIEGIVVHKYGCHYFHTNNKKIWDYINQFSDFYNCVPRVKVNYDNKIYSFPINLSTLNQIYGTITPEEAFKKLEEVKIKFDKPKNLEEWCLSQIGPDLYEIFIKNYTKKQWNKDPKELPVSIIKRIPIRLNYDDTYHNNAKYQGIPADGYTPIFEKLLQNVDVELNSDFEKIKHNWQSKAKNLIYSGTIDSFFNFCYGKLEYRSLRHETKIMDGSYQGCAQMNYTSNNEKFTRIIEHKFIQPYQESDKTVVTWEYPSDIGDPFYPINDEENNKKYKQYEELSKNLHNVLIGGRLGKAIYIDMDGCIAMALNHFNELTITPNF